jgi:hypothetical protein
MAKKIENENIFRTIKIGKKNIYIFLTGLALLVVGYVLMAQPPVYGFLSLTLAPIILVFAYLVVFPLSILVKDSGDKANN